MREGWGTAMWAYLKIGLLAASIGLAACADSPLETPVIVAHSVTAAERTPTSWRDAKNTASDEVYYDRNRTFYCGCTYESDNDSDGSGTMRYAGCGYEGPSSYSNRADRIEWEHIVPAGLTPVHDFECWAGDGGSRDKCEREDSEAQRILFDLHNLVPSIGQVNALRSDDYYGDLPDSTSDFGSCMIEDSRDTFEPPPCKRGDVARIWFYMQQRYGVVIPAENQDMLDEWLVSDPISPWESERERRIAAVSGVENPFVHGATPDASGACAWE